MGILSLLANLLAHEPHEICQLETPSDLDENSLVANDGSLISVFRLKGAYRFYSKHQEHKILEILSNEMRQNFTESGYKLDFILDIDASRAEAYVGNCLKSVDSVSKEMGYQNSRLNESERHLLASHIKPELSYIVMTTTPESVDNLNKKEGLKNHSSLAAEYDLDLKSVKKDTNVQNNWKETRQISDQHLSFVREMCSVITEYIHIEALTSHAALQEIRQLLYRDFDNSQEWFASTRHNSDCKVMNNESWSIETDEIGHTSLHGQIVEEEFEDCSKASLKKFNGKCYATLERYLVGDEPRLMRELVNKINRKIPMRIQYSLVSGSGSIKTAKGTKSSLTTFVARTNPISSSIMKACNQTIEFIRSGGCAVNCYLSVTLWGDTEDEVTSYYKAMQTALRGWGGERQRLCSFPTEGILSSLPGYSAKPIGRSSSDSLEQSMISAPLVRPVSPWNSGVMLYLTPDAKPWPMDFDDKQSHHLNVVTGAMGSGKSVAMGNLARSIHYLSGTSSLPLIAGVDYGESIIYNAQTIKANLKKEDQSQVAAVSLSNDKKNAYNIFEPQYGYNKLSKPEVNTATAFISRVVTGGSDNTAPPQLEACVSAIIEHMITDSVHSPKPIDPSQGGSDKIISMLDHPAVKVHLVSESNISYLNARNALFLATQNKSVPRQLRMQCLLLSKLAHRYMWPLLSALPLSLKGVGIQAKMGVFEYGNKPLLAVIGASIQLLTDRYSALLGTYPMNDFSDLSMLFVNAKPVVDSAPNSMKSAWFILAKGLAQRHFWTHVDDVELEADPVFYHRAMRIAKRKKPLPKYYYHDEWEQADSTELTSNIEKEAKTARKYREIITISTQMYEKISPDIRSLATNTFICNIPGRETEECLKRQFKITDNEFASFESYIGKTGIINGAGRGLLYIGILPEVQSPIIQPIVSMLPAGLVWQMASDAEDANFRELVVEQIGDRLPYDEINMAIGHVLGYPNMKKLIKTRNENEGVSDQQVNSDCLSNIMKYLNEAGVLA
ncbi:hypothetical protein [Vibrio splendidus]|uniref:hypothetical protein n=1 Tax=Vibrio splendidus TaxID=29497 RepID=UPI003D0B3832